MAILTLWSGRIVYLDTHAGRGRHETGEAGSPIVALSTFLNHDYSSRILRTCEVWFYFIEIDEDNHRMLQEEISDLGPVPQGVKIEISAGNGFEVMTEIIESLGTPRLDRLELTKVEELSQASSRAKVGSCLGSPYILQQSTTLSITYRDQALDLIWCHLGKSRRRSCCHPTRPLGCS